jgi:predicted phosphodiesterase
MTEKLAIQYISDIHLELLQVSHIEEFNQLFQPKAKICILAGDIGNPFESKYTEFLKTIHCQFQKIFLIAGNHEYYQNTISETKEQIKNVCRQFENISFLDNSYEDYDNIRLIGTTLWTHISKPQFTINDVNAIKDFDVEKYNQLHQNAVAFLTDTFTECQNQEKQSIVITHHLPLPELTLPKYKTMFYSKYNQWFCAELNSLVNENKNIIAAWIYGHTHDVSVQTHYGIPFYCNPIGYEHENDLGEHVNQVFVNNKM